MRTIHSLKFNTSKRLFIFGFVFVLFCVGIFTPPLAHAASWYNASWGYRKAITVNSAKVSTVSSTVLTNFPVLISFTDPDFKFGVGGKVASSTGADIIFTASDGVTPLNYEIETYSSSTGNLIAWVKVPTLSPSASTTIYAYLDNASATAPTASTAQNTWDSNFISVYHLGNGTTLNTNDSTEGAFNGTNNGATATTTGEILGGASFNGSSSYIYNNSFAAPDNSVTFSAWVTMTSNTSSWNAIADLGNGWLILNLAGGTGWGDVGWTVENSGGTNMCEVSDANVYNQQHLYTGTYDQASNAWLVYVDGNKVGSCTMTGSPTFSSRSTLTLGSMGKGAQEYLNGAIDEFRASSVARSADWINTEYNNQSNPPSFYSTSTLQTYVPTPIINSFTASPVYIGSGGTSTLFWNATGTITSITITPGTLSTTTPIGSITVNLVASTTYTLSVANTNGTSTLTTAVTIDTTPPTVPTGITVATTTPTSIALSWSVSTDAQSGLAGYDIYRNGTWIASTSPTTYIDTAVNSPSYAYYDDTGLSASTTYTYTIDSFDNVGNVSAQSSGLLASTSPQVISSQPMRSVGYYYSNRSSPVSAIYWPSLSYLDDAIANASSSGSLDLTNIVPTASSLVSAAHAHNVKVLLSISIFGSADPMSSTSSLAAFVNNIMSAVNTYGFDGVDIDFEQTSPDYTGLTALLSDLRMSLGSKLLTADMSYGNYAYWPTVASYIDQGNLMTYDMGGDSPNLWFNSPIHTPAGASYYYSFDLALQRYFSDGFPASKLNLGLPDYGYVYQGGCQTSGCTNGADTPLETFTTLPTQTQIYGPTLAAEYNLAATSTNPQWHWDIYSHEPYLSIIASTTASDTFVTYENSQSLTDKVNYAQSNNLGGVFLFSSDGDYFPSGSTTAQIYPSSNVITLALKAGSVSAPPSVSITAPAASSTVSGIVSVTATSSAVAPASIASVQFYLDGSPLGSAVTSSPYTISWNTGTATNASHTLYALATDNYSNTATSTSIMVTVANQAVLSVPTSTLNFSAAHGSTATSTQSVVVKNAGATSTTLNWSASSTQTWLTFSPSSGSLAGNVSTSVSFIVNPTGLAIGTYNATATIADPNASSSPQYIPVSFTISTTGIGTTLLSPTDDTIATGTISVSATATSTVGIASVQFYLDGSQLGSAVTSSPYTISWDTTMASDGSHSLYSEATDNNSNIASSSEITITVDNTPPSVSITSPTSGTTVSGTTSITASSSDAITGVSSVSFYLDGSFLGESTSSPYSINWDTTQTSNASHNLTAIATDSAGNATTSQAIPVTVYNAPPVYSGGGGGGGGSLQSNLAIVKTVDQSAPATGVTIHYTLTVSDGGPSNSSAVVASDMLPTGLTFNSASSSEGSYASSTGIWTIGTIPNGHQATLVITATVTAATGTIITNTGTVSENPGILNATPQDDTSSATITVAGGGGVTSSSPSSTLSALSGMTVAEMQSLLASLESQLQALEAQVGNATISSPYIFTTDLQLHDTGPAVNALQNYLIREDKGPAATKLKIHGATNYFGILTYNALVEFQASVGIHATGYFGPITRAWVNSHP
jgi:uncharacterized repeat protein (TIGR01451 family)